MKQLTDQVECTVAYVNKKREDISFSPKDDAVVFSFIQDEKVSGMSPLLKYYRSLQQKAEQKKTSLQNSSLLVQEVKSKGMIND